MCLDAHIARFAFAPSLLIVGVLLLSSCSSSNNGTDNQSPVASVTGPAPTFETPFPRESTPTPNAITIRGQQVPLSPGMDYYSGGTTICEGAPCPSGVFTEVRYDSNLPEAGWSWLVFDENYTLRGSHIRPEDQEEFQPLLDALGAP
jgi:hypothetical protein